jgi:ribosomal-protein-alanine N-acetyltransferase
MLTLETKRTCMRPLLPLDAEHFFMLNQDPEVLQFTGDKAFESLSEASVFLERYDQYSRYKLGRFAVLCKKSNTFYGWCGLKFHPETGEYDIGFRFYKAYWGQGLASETAKEWLRYAFEERQLNEVYARANKANIASLNVLEKLGMNAFGTLDQDNECWLLYKMKKESWPV